MALAPVLGAAPDRVDTPPPPRHTAIWGAPTRHRLTNGEAGGAPPPPGSCPRPDATRPGAGSEEPCRARRPRCATPPGVRAHGAQLCPSCERQGRCPRVGRLGPFHTRRPAQALPVSTGAGGGLGGTHVPQTAGPADAALSSWHFFFLTKNCFLVVVNVHNIKFSILATFKCVDCDTKSLTLLCGHHRPRVRTFLLVQG